MKGIVEQKRLTVNGNEARIVEGQRLRENIETKQEKSVDEHHWADCLDEQRDPLTKRAS